MSVLPGGCCGYVLSWGASKFFAFFSALNLKCLNRNKVLLAPRNYRNKNDNAVILWLGSHLWLSCQPSCELWYCMFIKYDCSTISSFRKLLSVVNRVVVINWYLAISHSGKKFSSFPSQSNISLYLVYDVCGAIYIRKFLRQNSNKFAFHYP